MRLYKLQVSNVSSSLSVFQLWSARPRIILLLAFAMTGCSEPQLISNTYELDIDAQRWTHTRCVTRSKAVTRQKQWLIEEDAHEGESVCRKQVIPALPPGVKP